ncbi:hypothetical protein F5Y18DRAFT_429630 [Xylariaceae sp. FL1019]|nr:hypothetical protein F5Y18DRAFT_429630 [Xylariaceae sp. FL1019]
MVGYDTLGRAWSPTRSTELRVSGYYSSPLAVHIAILVATLILINVVSNDDAGDTDNFASGKDSISVWESTSTRPCTHPSTYTLAATGDCPSSPLSPAGSKSPQRYVSLDTGPASLQQRNKDSMLEHAASILTESVPRSPR